MISTVLEGATIIDGSGRPGFETDVAFTGGRIALIGDCSDREARRRFDCRGKIAAPGFIDACSQSGEKWLTAFRGQSKHGQGICGEIMRISADSYAQTWEESLTIVEVLDLARRASNGTFGSFLVSREGVQAAEAGAAGLWIDLAATTLEEAVAMARECALAGAPHASVGLREYGEGVVEAVDDAITLAERANVHVHLRDYRVEFPRSSGRMERTLERIDRARERGASITCDVTPYTARWIRLATLLPRGVTPEALDDAALAAAVAMEMQARHGDVWHDLILAQVGSEERMAWCGVRFDEIANMTWKSPARAVVDVIRDEGERAHAFLFCLKEDDVAMLLSAAFCAIGTAERGFSLTEAPFGLIHPRAFGAFPRIFGRFVRQRRALTIEEAVRRMTALPARSFGLEGRGELVPGAPADVVVFDPRTFTDTATYDRPFSLPVGLTHLFRDGVEVPLTGGST